MANSTKGEAVMLADLNVRRISSSPPAWLVSNFLSPNEMAFLKEAHSPAMLSCFPGLPEPLVHHFVLPYLGSKFMALVGMRVCREVNNEEIPKREAGNAVLKAVNSRMESFLTKGLLYKPFRQKVLDFQIVQYRRGGTFKLHRDEDMSGQGFPLTMMAYLNTVPEGEGGETVFPLSLPSPMEVRPIAGDLLVWSTAGVGGKALHESQHAGLPPTNEEGKWILNKFWYDEDLRWSEGAEPGFKPFEYFL
jgi:hypothetical protein